jgi:hypothetical protein
MPSIQPSAAKSSSLGLRLHEFDSALSSKSDDTNQHSPIRSHTFHLLNLLSKDDPCSIVVTVVMIIIDFLQVRNVFEFNFYLVHLIDIFCQFQLLSFALLPSAGFAWYSPAVSWLQNILNPFGLNQVAGGYDSNTLVYLALIAVSVALSLMGFLLYALSQNDIEYSWALQSMRVIAGSTFLILKNWKCFGFHALNCLVHMVQCCFVSRSSSLSSTFSRFNCRA